MGCCFPPLSQSLRRWRRGLVVPATLGLCLSGLGLAPLAWSQTKKPAAVAQPSAQPAKVDAGASKPAAHSILRDGSQGSEVVELQAMLKLLGYYGGAVNGVYDPAMATAVTQFQKMAGLTADGIVGAETWDRLLPAAPAISATATPAKTPPSQPTSFPTPATQPATQPANSAPPIAAKSSEDAALPILRLGMKGSAVSGLQERLRSLGVLKGAADGVFGAETHDAVKAVQRRFSLEPDGIVGLSTWMALLR